MYYLECKCMLKKDGRFILGKGRADLLKTIERTGSMSEAAKEKGMSYRHAWGRVKRIEESLGEKVIITHRGGKDKGGSELTETGKKLLEDYEELKKQHKEKVFKKPSLTVDGIISKEDKILLIRRKNDPFKGRYALPGGFVEYGETVEDAVLREIKEETGLSTEINNLIGVYSDPDRDPRGHTVSVVFDLKIKKGKLESSSDALSADFFPMEDLPELSFDHKKIIQDGLLSSSD